MERNEEKILHAKLMLKDISSKNSVSNCHTAITKCHRPGGLNNRNVLLTILEVRS